MSAKLLHTVGVKRSGAYVTVAAVGGQVVVRWREGVRKSKAFPSGADGKRHAKAFAQGVHDRLARGQRAAPDRLTVAEVFRRYVTANETNWRPKTRVNEHNRWGVFVAIVGAETWADVVTQDALDEVSKRLRATGGKQRRGMAPNQVRYILSNVKRVWALAKTRRWIAENPLADYRIPWAKEDRVTSVDEFSPVEAARLMAQLTAKDGRRWRAHVACRIAGTQGARVNALLRAYDADYDLVARTVRWRAETDKLGLARVQPLTRDAVAAVRIARIWRRRIGYTGQYLLPAVRAARRAVDAPYGYQGLVRLLHVACAEAGVEVKALRAMHAFRRMAGTTVLALTGNMNAAMEWIGDRDPRVFKRSYVKERPDALRATAALLRMPTETDGPTAPVRHFPNTRGA